MITDKDLAAIDRLIAPQDPSKPPERIYGWTNSQLSIARFYGGIVFNGHRYVISGQGANDPLVRADVMQREARAQREAVKAQRKAEKEAAKAAQGGLL